MIGMAILGGILVISVIVGFIFFKKGFFSRNLQKLDERKEKFLCYIYNSREPKIPNEINQFLRSSKLIYSVPLHLNGEEIIDRYFVLLSDDEEWNNEQVRKIQAEDKKCVFATYDSKFTRGKFPIKIYLIPNQMRKIIEKLGGIYNADVFNAQMKHLKQVIHDKGETSNSDSVNRSWNGCGILRPKSPTDSDVERADQPRSRPLSTSSFSEDSRRHSDSSVDLTKAAAGFSAC